MPPAGRVEFHFQDEDEDIEYAPPVLEVTGAPGHPSGGLAVEPGDELKRRPRPCGRRDTTCDDHMIVN